MQAARGAESGGCVFGGFYDYCDFIYLPRLGLRGGEAFRFLMAAEEERRRRRAFAAAAAAAAVGFAGACLALAAAAFFFFVVSTVHFEPEGLRTMRVTRGEEEDIGLID